MDVVEVIAQFVSIILEKGHVGCFNIYIYTYLSINSIFIYIYTDTLCNTHTVYIIQVCMHTYMNALHMKIGRYCYQRFKLPIKIELGRAKRYDNFK